MLFRSKEQLEEELRKNEILVKQLEEWQMKSNSSVVKVAEDSKKDVEELKKQIEYIKAEYETKLNDLQESHIEGELASSVIKDKIIGGD